MKALENLGVGSPFESETRDDGSQDLTVGGRVPPSDRTVFRTMEKGQPSTFRWPLLDQVWGQEQGAQLTDELGVGQRADWQLPIAPTHAGNVPISWELTFTDLNGVSQKATGTEYIQVSRREEGSPSTTIVAGDYLSPGAAKQGEGVLVQKAGESPEHRPFSYCPSCGERLELPKTASFCPYCGGQLS